MELTTPKFDPVKYKNTTHDQWQTAAEAWYRWSPTLNQWLGKATDKMLEMADITSGHRVLDIAAGAGEQSITTAKKVGASGYVLATDISANILEYAKQMAQQAGAKNIDTRVMDGENLTLEDETFDAVTHAVAVVRRRAGPRYDTGGDYAKIDLCWRSVRGRAPCAGADSRTCNAPPARRARLESDWCLPRSAG